MLPLRLELRNFLAYRAPEPIKFDGVELACLTGRNGVGKSALLDAMTWALWGRARARRDEDLIHLGRGDMHVALDFEQEGLRYRVQRRRSRSGTGSRGALDLWVLDGARPRAISESTMRRTQAKIIDILRLDYETFVHSAFLQQGRADAFTLKTAAERKRILSDILGLDRWTDYESDAKTRLAARQAEIELLDADIRAFDDELQKAPQLQAELDSAIAALAAAQAQLDEANAAYEKVAHSAAALRRERDSLRELDERIGSRQSEIAAAQSEAQRQQQRIDSCREVIAQSDDIAAGYAELQAARSSQSAIAEQLAQQQDLERRCHELERALADEGAELEGKAGVIRERMRGLQDALQAADALDLPDLQRQLDALEALAARRDRARKRQSSLREKRSALQTKQASLTEEGQALNERLRRLQGADGAQCPLCGQPLTAQHRDQTLSLLTTELDGKREDYRRCNQGIGEIDAQHAAQETELARWTRDLEALPGLQRAWGAASETARRADEARASLDTETRALQQLEARLQNQDYGGERRHQLAQLRSEQADIAYDADSHADIRAKLRAYDRYDRQQTRLDFAQRTLPEAQRAHAEVSERLGNLEATLASDGAKRSRLLDDIAALEEQVKAERDLRGEVDRRRADAQRQSELKTIAQQELHALDMGRRQQHQRRAQLDSAQHKADLLAELRTAFGRNGVPAMIIDSAIPELESAANALLARMTEGRMSLALSTQRQGSGGDMLETLDIEIADELGARPYELYSGGEAFRINFALRIALSRLLARRAGAQLRTLFIDEGFGSQDEEGRGRLVEAINAIRGDIDLILVITHIDDLRDAFPLHLLVEKSADGSTVSWQ